MFGRTVIPVIVIIWLVIGVLAAIQRGYFSDSEQNCASVGTTALTVLAGPLNYVGVNPEIDCPELEVPQPSE